MLQASGRSYVCWRCAGRSSGSGPGPASPWLHTSVKGSFRHTTQYISPASRRALATVRHVPSKYDNPVESLAKKLRRDTPLRRELIEWQKENPSEREMILADYADDGHLSNNTTRPQNTSMAQIDNGDTSPLFVDDEMMDLRSDDAMLAQGDLVELSSEGSRRPVLAICLGRIDGYEHFYTISGKWFAALGVKALFVVNSFVKPDELEPVIAALPPAGASIEVLNALRDLGDSPSRLTGAPLLRKMLQFTQSAENVFQANAATLDASSAFIGDPVKHRYLTLHEIADLLLPESYKNSDRFEPHALYAVHRALLQDEVFFRPLRATGHKRSYLFEISPLSEVRIIQKAEKLARDYLERRNHANKTAWNDESLVESFAIKAREIIDESRKNRGWSENGIIGPSLKLESVQTKPTWSDTDLEILQFIELWAGYQKFPAYSSLQTIGSTFLRAIERYQEAKGFIPSVGWTFLQEVGWIPPWEIPARYSVRFPGVEIKRGGSYVRPYMGMLDRHLKRDMLALIRKPLKKVTAYCIDDITAREIDDAVSLERTSNPDKYWIHVHVADPASSFGADTPVAKYAELIPEAIYLPGHLEPMLPEDLIHDRFSLAPDRPCLTFSALVNVEGAILSERITANVLENVIYMTYEDAASAIGEVRKHPSAQNTQWSLGEVSKSKAVGIDRKMSRPDELTKGQKADLAILSKLGKVIQAGRLKKGATPFFQSRPTAAVDFSSVEKKESDGFITTSGDPSIRVYYARGSGTDLVENAMKLANEVAARWCHQRDIPIPYRTQPHAVPNAALILQYARDVLNPMLDSGVRPDDRVWAHMRSLLGLDEVSTTPGQHFTIGSDMYTKATSPLRRFGDLIVHWQIEAALLEEKKLGRELIGSKGGKGKDKRMADDLSFLPFSRERLDRMLPMIRLRERQARSLTNMDGTDQWILQALVRAWRFKEAPLPETFKLTVSQPARARAFGRLDWFERMAILKHGALNDVIVGADLRVGDVLEVRITDVNVHSKQIHVEALRMLERGPNGRRGTGAAQVPPGGPVAAEHAPVQTI
ncbi:putative mitochondrial protein cyt-4 protein [Rosellinia necatrix]|uniref:Putative mitochondrial protein cyt-4 protein n=1 Tax=Rosellinia necatrix TaxID=77044 RepID=A0A1S7UJL7_ROSNE|nr:putative mitochondrial protein cyt-4 protein [Rosellinia necatrix]